MWEKQSKSHGINRFLFTWWRKSCNSECQCFELELIPGDTAHRSLGSYPWLVTRCFFFRQCHWHLMWISNWSGCTYYLFIFELLIYKAVLDILDRSPVYNQAAMCDFFLWMHFVGGCPPPCSGCRQVQGSTAKGNQSLSGRSQAGFLPFLQPESQKYYM